MTTYKELPVSETLESVHSLIPYEDSNETERKKSTYLSYRYSGFSIREAIGLASISESTLRRWRDIDEKFTGLEQQATGEGRSKLRKEVIQTQFIRNYRRVLDLDSTILEKMHYAPDSLSKSEDSYLARMRSHYTPQQMELLERILDPSIAKNVSFDQMLLSAFRVTKTPDGTEVQEGITWQET
jgi:hypothetical protein